MKETDALRQLVRAQNNIHVFRRKIRNLERVLMSLRERTDQHGRWMIEEELLHTRSMRAK